MCEMKGLDGSNPPLGQRVPISGASQHAEIVHVWDFIRLCGISPEFSDRRECLANLLRALEANGTKVSLSEDHAATIKQLDEQLEEFYNLRYLQPAGSPTVGDLAMDRDTFAVLSAGRAVA